MSSVLGEKGRWRREVWHTGTVGILPEITSQYEETMAEGSRDHTYGGGGEEEEGRRILSGMQGRMSPPTCCVANSHPHSGNRDTAEVEGIDQLQVL